MVDRLERFLSSKKKRYLLGFTGAGFALGLSVLATDTNLLALNVQDRKKVSKELVGAKGANVTINLFNETKSSNFTAPIDVTSGYVRLRLDNAEWGSNCTKDTCAICNGNESVAEYYTSSSDKKALIFTVKKDILEGVLYYFSNATCNGSTPIDVNIPKGTTSDVNLTLELGGRTLSTKLIELKDQYSLASIQKGVAKIDANNNTIFTNNQTTVNATLSVDNATDLNKYANQFNATLALDKFPNWLDKVTVNATNCNNNITATNYKGLEIKNCTNGTYTFTFKINGTVPLYPEKISLDKFEIRQVEGENYTKDLLGTYSGDKTLLEVDYDGIVLYIPRFAQAASGRPSTTIFLMTNQQNAEVKVCRFDNTCYNATIPIDNRGISLYQRDPNLQRFLNGYYGALRLHLLNVSNPSTLACYAIFTRADGTSLRVPCLTGGGAEQ